MDPNQLPPDLVAQLIGLGTSDEEALSLAKQLEQARALRMGGSQQHSTGWGAALGGLGDVVNKFHSYSKEKDLLGKQNELLKGQTEARKRFADEYLKRMSGSPANLVGPPGAPVQYAKDPYGNDFA